MALPYSDSLADSSELRCNVSAGANRFVRFNCTPPRRSGTSRNHSQLVREKRETANQTLGFASRPFVLCGLPVKRPRLGILLHERRNGRFLLQVTGHPSYGLPWGQDRLVPLYLATLAVRQQSETITFDSGAEMLDTFGLQQGGSQYRRLIEAFQRVFGATIFFGTNTHVKTAVFHQVRFNFMSEARIWYGRNLDLYLALLSVLHCQGRRTHPAVWGLWPDQPSGQWGISAASEIPGMPGELAGLGEGHVALVSGTDQR